MWFLRTEETWRLSQTNLRRGLWGAARRLPLAVGAPILKKIAVLQAPQGGNGSMEAVRRVFPNVTSAESSPDDLKVCTCVSVHV